MAVVLPPPLLLVVDVEVVVEVLVEEARRSGRSPNEMRSALDSSMDNSMISDDDGMILVMLLSRIIEVMMMWILYVY